MGHSHLPMAWLGIAHKHPVTLDPRHCCTEMATILATSNGKNTTQKAINSMNFTMLSAGRGHR